MLIRLFICLVLTGHAGIVNSQSKTVDFDRYYQKGLDLAATDVAGARSLLTLLESNRQEFTHIQQAKTDYLRFRITSQDTESLKILERKMYSPPDSLGHFDGLVYSAHKYLEKSMPDKAIPLLMIVLDSLPAGAEKAAKSVIYLSEAYREKREYSKGLGLLYDLLSGNEPVSDENRAFAYNRIAAIYNECGNTKIQRSDSVYKYSQKCISLAETIGSYANLGFSQNELSYQYMVKKQWEKALELSQKSVENFQIAGMTYSTMNALINQSNIFLGMGKNEMALQTILKATGLCPIEENRNLMMRVYYQVSLIYKIFGKYRDALEFQEIANALQSDFFKDRINEQINEKSAKYDLLVKEQKILEERQKNSLKQKQISFLVFFLVFLCLIFVAIILTIRLKRKNFIKQKLIEAVVETEFNERKRIARDLHDGLGPVISALNHYFQAYIDAKESEKILIQTKMQQVISDSIDEISRISHNISPYILEKHGLNMALKNFISPLIDGNKIKIRFNSDFNDRFELKRELTIYRCITELINNTLKHSGAEEISVNITEKDNVLTVFYSDNGRGFEQNNLVHEGMGLSNIKNRVETFGGKITIESTIDNGIWVYIGLPLK
jgi:signal transduction histidine kinase